MKNRNEIPWQLENADPGLAEVESARRKMVGLQSQPCLSSPCEHWNTTKTKQNLNNISTFPLSIYPKLLLMILVLF